MTAGPTNSPVTLPDGREVVPVQCIQCQVLTVPRSVPVELVPDGMRRTGARGRCTACYPRFLRGEFSPIAPTLVREDDDVKTANNRRHLAAYLKARRERIMAWTPEYRALIQAVNDSINEELEDHEHTD